MIGRAVDGLRHRRARWAAVGALLVLSACSVTTPRDDALTVRGDDLGSSTEVGTSDAGASTSEEGDAGPAGLGPTGEILVGDSGKQPQGTAQGSQRVSPAAPASGAAARVVGVDDDTIVVSVALPFSGALGQIYTNYFSTAFTTWAEDVNERGGIHGRKLELKKVDNLGTIDGQVAACREIQSNGSFVAIVDSGTISDTEADCLNDAGFPALTNLTPKRNPNWRSVRALLSAESGRALGSYIRNPLGGAGKKIGVLVAPNYIELKNAAVDGAKDAGLDVVRVENVAANQASFTSELLRLRQSGAEVVAIITGVEVIGILRDAKAIGYSPTWTGTPWPGDELSIAAGELMSGVRALRYWVTVDAPAAERYRALVAKHGNGNPTPASMAMYGQAVVLGRALELAGRELDRDAVRAGFDRMSGFDPGLIPLMTFSAGKVVGSSANFPVRCCNERREWIGTGPASDRF